MITTKTVETSFKLVYPFFIYILRLFMKYMYKKKMNYYSSFYGIFFK